MPKTPENRFSDDPFALAAEHIAWCIRRGMTLAEVFECLDSPYRQQGLGVLGRRRTWHDALIIVASECDRCTAMQVRQQQRRAA